ncbi:alpha/beta hydrolase [Gymnodinialimonas sp. 2305UL16-5]|uniref:alpha/beta fold hydrolase n=1 Tax=Gymnodinialimonas mytili TaxID=3126503 RepID=UPI00309CE73E
MDLFEFRSSDELTLRYTRKGNGPLVIALHGFPDTFRTWDQMASRLVSEGYTFVALAMRGYAPSDISETGTYSIDRLALDVLELIDHLQCEKALIIGHDWGASTAYAIAALYPERVSRIVTFAIAPLAVAPSGWRERWARPHNIYLGFGALSDWWFRRGDFREIGRLYRLWSPNWDVPTPHLNRVGDALRPPERSRAAIEYYRLGKTAQSSKSLIAPTHIPALIVYGEDEPGIRKAAFRRALSAVGEHSKLIEIAGAGHWPHLEASEQCFAEVSDFISSQRQP